MNEPTTTDSPSRLRGAVILIVLAMLAAALLSTVDRFTAPRIADNIAAERLKGLRAVLPPDSYDNEPHLDIRMVLSPELLGSDEPLPVYRARRGDQPVAAVLTAVAPNGFSGHIHLLVAVDVEGIVTGVRVIEHRETPGLGDRIEARKSDWMLGFRSLNSAALLTGNTQPDEWVLKRDGGSFDQITGATVTSRAALNAVRNAVIYFAAHRQELFAPSSNEQPEPRATN
jgi:electron transport complex protein RnfG